MNRRHFAALVVAALLVLPLAPAASAAPVNIVRIWTEFRLEEEQVRLGEIVSGQEVSGGAIVHRTQPGSREGFYFTIRVDRARKVRATAYTLRLSVIAPDTDEPRVFTFPVEPSKKKGVRLDIGLTGSDWTHGDAQPLAWRVEVLDAAGAVVADEKSFLWEKPPAPES